MALVGIFFYYLMHPLRNIVFIERQGIGSALSKVIGSALSKVIGSILFAMVICVYSLFDQPNHPLEVDIAVCEKDSIGRVIELRCESQCILCGEGA